MKRILAEDDDAPQGKRPRIQREWREAVTFQLAQRWLVPTVEPFFRRVVQEELGPAIMAFFSSGPRPSINRIQPPCATGLQLHFNNRLTGDPLFTFSRISPIKIVIRSTDSKELVTTGPLSSIKVEMVVLDGDFGRGDKEDWTKEEFNAHVVRRRDGRRPLLIGELVIALRDGIGTFGDVAFTDNSRWMRSGRFKLGVRVKEGSGIEERVREARSESILVKDHRGESSQKRDRPSLEDEIWRLKNIRENGAYCVRLHAKGIKTVQEFLQAYNLNAHNLQNVIGMKNKEWEETLRHAQKCVIDDKYYMYSSSEMKITLLLNPVYEVVGVRFDGCQNFQFLDHLPPSKKNLVENLKKHAYENQKEIIEWEGQPLFDPSKPSIQEAGLYKPNPYLPNPDVMHPSFLTDGLASSNHICTILPSQGPAISNLPQQQGNAELFGLMHGNDFNPHAICHLQQQDTHINQNYQMSEQVATFQSQDNTFGDINYFDSPLGECMNNLCASGSNFMDEVPNVDLFNGNNGMVGTCVQNPKALVKGMVWAFISLRKRRTEIMA